MKLKHIFKLFIPSKRKARFSIYFLGLLLLLLIVLSAFIYLNESRIENKIKKQITSLYHLHLEKKLGLKLTHLTWSSHLKEILKGDLKGLELTLENDALKIELKTDLQLHLKQFSFRDLLNQTNLTKFSSLSFQTSPQITLTHKPLSQKIIFHGECHANLPDSFTLKGYIKDFQIPDLFLKLSSIELDLKVQDKNTDFSLFVEKIEVNNEQKKIMAQVNQLKLNAITTLDFSLPMGMRSLQAGLFFKESELLVEDHYFSIPKNFLKPSITLQWKTKEEENLVQSMALETFLGKKPFFNLISSTFSKNHQPFQSIQWKIPSTSLSELGPILTLLTQKEEFSILKSLHKGSLHSEGTLEIPLNKNLSSTTTFWTHPSFFAKGLFQLKNLTLIDKNFPIFFKDFDFIFPFHSQKNTRAHIHFKKLFFRKLEFPSQTISLNVSPQLNIQLNTPFALKNSYFTFNLPHFSFDYQKDKTLLDFTLEVPQIEKLAEPLCLDTAWVPPSRLDLNYKKILIEKGHLSTIGHTRLELFDGLIELNELKVFDVFSQVPESQFQLTWDHIQLESLGQFLNFGKMNGSFRGYAKEVTMQGLLPTQFDFLLKAEPLPRKPQVVFSSLAMKNLVMLLSGDSFTMNLPKFAEWFAFGPPSQLLGGYNVNYFGVSLYSKKGLILLKTLDPETRLDKDHKNYILYGPRFKIPIQSVSYPVVLDAPAMGHFVRHMLTQFENLKKQEESVQIKEQENQKESQNENKTNECIPHLNF